MLVFEIGITEYAISDNYDLSPKREDLINSMWKNILLESEPSLPCPIDRMYNEVVSIGAKIKQYKPEFNPNLIY